MVFLGLENYYFLNQCCNSNPTLHHSHKSWTQGHGDCCSQSASPLRMGLPCCSEPPSGKEDLLHRRQGLQPGLRTASSVFLQNTAEACPLPGAAHIQGQTDGWAQRPLSQGSSEEHFSCTSLQRVRRGCHWDGFTAQLKQSSTLLPSFFLTNSLYTNLCHGACLLGKPQKPLPLTCNARGSSPQGRRGGTPHRHSCYGLGSKTGLLEGPSLKPPA